MLLVEIGLRRISISFFIHTFHKGISHVPPLNLDSIDENLWNDKCDYIDPNSCTNLNPNDYNLIVIQLNKKYIV